MKRRWSTISVLWLWLIGIAVSQADTTYLELRPSNANKQIGLLSVDDDEFSPANGESRAFRFAVNESARVTLDVYSADGDLIRRLVDAQEFDSGQHRIRWDGQDADGQVVPDEVYVPVFTATDPLGTTIDDPRRYSGGEIVTDFEWTLRGDTELSYDMPYPVRVLIRTGVKDGPMMRELKHWEPVAPGKAVVRWDGYDKDGVENFAVRDDVWFVVMAYRIPEYAVITSGNKKIEYLAYRQSKGWETAVPDLTAIELQRNGVRLEQDYFLPRAYLPRVILEFAEPSEMSRVGIPLVGDRVQFKINVPAEDKWILDSSFYETGFYINYEFQSEEEQGFVPLIWEYDASSLPPGRHIATVQLFGFGGFISSDTIEFLVAP